MFNPLLHNKAFSTGPLQVAYWEAGHTYKIELSTPSDILPENVEAPTGPLQVAIIEKQVTPKK